MVDAGLFETVVPAYEDAFYGEDSGAFYEKDMSGVWWADLNDEELGPFNTLLSATEAVACRWMER